MPPCCRTFTLAESLSTQITSWPTSAKQAPVTSPTYPVPMMVSFIEKSQAKQPGGQKKQTSPGDPEGLFSVLDQKAAVNQPGQGAAEQWANPIHIMVGP